VTDPVESVAGSADTLVRQGSAGCELWRLRLTVERLSGGEEQLGAARRRVTPGPGDRRQVEPQSVLPLTPAPFAPRPLRPPRLDWATLLRRTFGFEVLQCPCGGRRQVLVTVTDWAEIDEELRKRGLAPSLRATVVPTHRGPRQAELALDLPAVPRPRSHSPPPGAELLLAS